MRGTATDGTRNYGSSQLAFAASVVTNGRNMASNIDPAGKCFIVLRLLTVTTFGCAMSDHLLVHIFTIFGENYMPCAFLRTYHKLTVAIFYIVVIVYNTYIFVML